MCASNESIKPYYMEFLCCAICSQKFEYENPSYHPVTLPICGHTLCRQCIDTLDNETQCPKNQIPFGINNTRINQLPTNYPLLILVDQFSKLPEDSEQRYGQCLSYIELDDKTKEYFNTTQNILGKISYSIKRIIDDKNYQSTLSRSMVRKIFNLLNSQYIVREGRLKVCEAARSLGEWTCINFIFSQKNRQQFQALKDRLWSAVRSRGCAFQGPTMQKDILESILSDLQDGSTLKYYDLVKSFEQKRTTQNADDDIERNFGSVIELLRLTSCFEEEQVGSYLFSLRLKSEFRDNEILRRAHDKQIIKIAMEDDLYMPPEQWSILLHGNTQYESSIQSIIDELSTSTSFSEAINEFSKFKENHSNKNSFHHLFSLQDHFEKLSRTGEGNNDQQDDTDWILTIHLLRSLKEVLQGIPPENYLLYYPSQTGRSILRT